MSKRKRAAGALPHGTSKVENGGFHPGSTASFANCTFLGTRVATPGSVAAKITDVGA